MEQWYALYAPLYYSYSSVGFIETVCRLNLNMFCHFKDKTVAM